MFYYDEVHDVADAVDVCQNAGVKIILTSPDDAENTLNLARQTKIIRDEVTDLDLKDTNEFIRTVSN